MADAIRRGAFLLLVALTAACGQRGNKPAVDSNSNWLSVCEVSADCGGDGSCICGLCTRTCSDDAQCYVAGPSASCVAPTAASDEVACAALVTSAHEQLCLAECSDDRDCTSGTQCREHACWPEPTGLVDVRDAAVDAGHVTTGAAGEPSQVQMPIAPDDFSTPVVQPMPEISIAGSEASALVGTWQEVATEIERFYDLAIQLDIQELEGGGYAGTITFVCAKPVCAGPIGPPPPATDPARGYPPDLLPKAQDLLRVNALPATPYRMLDAHAEDGRLSFTWSNSDLWRDWCALQTPYPTDVAGRDEYACVADARSCADVMDQAGWLPDDSTEIAAKKFLCCAGGGVCHCDAQSCAAYLQGAQHSVDLTIEGDSMRGIATLGTDPYAFVLQRVRSQP